MRNHSRLLHIAEVVAINMCVGSRGRESLFRVPVAVCRNEKIAFSGVGLACVIPSDTLAVVWNRAEACADLIECLHEQTGNRGKRMTCSMVVGALMREYMVKSIAGSNPYAAPATAKTPVGSFQRKRLLETDEAETCQKKTTRTAPFISADAAAAPTATKLPTGSQAQETVRDGRVSNVSEDDT